MTRYRIAKCAPCSGTTLAGYRGVWPDNPNNLNDADLPLVHVFRDDELDDLARRIAAEVSDGFAVDAAVIYVVRNHGSNQ